MTRSLYFFTVFFLQLILVFVESSMEKEAAAYTALVLLPINILFVSQRLKDIGMSRWWTLSIFVPILNIYTAFMLYFAPTGYNDPNSDNHKKSDSWFNFGLTLAFVLIIVAFWYTASQSIV